VIGARFDARMSRLLLEANIKRLREERRGFNTRIFEAVYVASLDRTRRIKEIGFNKPGDLILDNFGAFLAALFSTPGTTVAFDARDITNNVRTLGTYRSNPFNGPSASYGSRFQLGSGSTTPARGNYIIETALPTAPESGVFGSGPGSYASGVVSCSSSVTAGGAGTVREAGWFGYWMDVTVAARTIMLFHDLISPVVPYVAGNVLTCAYSVNL